MWIEPRTETRSTPIVEVKFLTRQDCHLCEAAYTHVSAVVSRTGAELVVVDIDAHEDLRDRYDWDVPVVLVNGRQTSFHRVDEVRLERAVRAAADRSSAEAGGR